MSEHTTEETLMYLRQCLLPGNVQDGIDLEVPSWLVREATTALDKLSKMERRIELAQNAMNRADAQVGPLIDSVSIFSGAWEDLQEALDDE